MPDAPRGWRLGFWSLIATQFQGAFNDNGLKFLILYLIVGTNLTTEDQQERDVLLVGRPVRVALHFVLDEWRLSGRSFQQAHGHRRHENF